MPLKKGKSKSRRKFSRKGGSKLATVKQVKKMISSNIETKFHLFNLQGDVDNTGSSLVTLTAVPQSASPQQSDQTRIGDEITIRAMKINLTMYWNHAAPGIQFVTLRAIVFQFKEQSTTTPTPTAAQVLYSVGTQFMPVAFQQKDGESIIHILYDKMFSLDTAKAKSNAFKLRVPMKYCKKKIQFVAGSTLAANHLYLLLVSSEGVASGNKPSFLLQSNFYFDDA